MYTQSITPELYEEIKTQVLAEQKATRLAKSRENAKRRQEALAREQELERKKNEAIAAVHTTIRDKYAPGLAALHRKDFMTAYDAQGFGKVIEKRIQSALIAAMRIVGVGSLLQAYIRGELEKVQRLACEMLDAILKGE